MTSIFYAHSLSETIAEKGILLFVENCKALGVSKERASIRWVEKYEIADAVAEEWIRKYWNE